MTRPIHGGNLAWAAALVGCPPSVILDFSASINPLGPPQSAIAAIQTHLGTLSTYPDPDYRQLRAALSQLHGLPIEWIFPGNGAAELLTWAARDLSALSATRMLTPAFGDYYRSLQSFGASVKSIPLDLTLNPHPYNRETAVCPQLPLLSLSSQKPKAKSQNTLEAGLLLNNPHNPTGKVWLKEAVLACLQEFALVVVDEAFMDFLRPEEQQSLVGLLQNFPNLVILRSLTKFYSLPGLRLGYAIAHPDRLHRWQRWRDPWPVNVLAAAAAAAVVQDTAFQHRTWAWLQPARSQLFQGLAQLPGLIPYPSAANFLLVRSNQPSPWLQHQLLQRHRILIRDCLSFPELGDRYFRVAVRSPSENQHLLEGLADILEVV